MKKILLIFIAVVLAAIICFAGYSIFNNFSSKNDDISQNITSEIQILDSDPQVLINNAKIAVEIADTNEEKSKGLSGRTSLSDGKGMLFPFDQKISPAFWMKDMLISIDIIWIADGKIVAIDKNVPFHPPGTPDSVLPLYRPPEPIDHVLEVSGGYSDKIGAKPGDSIEFFNLN